MLEKMDAFFNRRVTGYDAHMLRDIESAEIFYPFTAGLLPKTPGARVLDLGCGTGLELEYYFAGNPTANVVGIDLAADMLRALREKFPDRDLETVQGSYFEVPLGVERYDAAVSVESLHHFTREEKLPLYRRLQQALKPGGYFVLTDYFAPTEEDEKFFRQELLQLKAEQGIADDAFYHYDTPLTRSHEMQILEEAGFTQIRLLGQWGATCTIKAEK